MPPLKEIIIPDFRGGLNTEDSVEELAENQVVETMNMVVDGGTAAKRAGFALAQTGAAAVASGQSLFPYEAADGTRWLYHQYGTSFQGSDADVAIGSFSFSNKKGAVTIDASSDFRSVVFDDICYIVSGTTSNNGFQIASPSSSLTAWNPTDRNDARDITAWGRRIFTLEVGEPNVTQWSALGDAENYASGGNKGSGWAAIGTDDPGKVTKVIPWNGWLWFFKERSIYAIIPQGLETETEGWQFKRVVSGYGTAHPRSVVETANDLLFYDRQHGIVSLANAVNQGEDSPRRASYSIKVPELSTGVSPSSTMAAVNVGYQHQVWFSDDVNEEVWVMDYSNLSKGVDDLMGQHISWWRWNGAVSGKEFVNMFTDTQHRPIVMGSDHIYVQDTSRYNDETIDGSSRTPTEAYFLTKAYTLGVPMVRKDWVKFGTEFDIATTNADLYITLRPDGEPKRDKLYTITISGGATGSSLGGSDTYWNDALSAGSFILGGGQSTDSDFLLNLRGSWGRRAESMQVKFQEQLPNVDEHFAVKRLLFGVNIIGTYQVDNT